MDIPFSEEELVLNESEENCVVCVVATLRTLLQEDIVHRGGANWGELTLGAPIAVALVVATATSSKRRRQLDVGDGNFERSPLSRSLN